MTPFPPLPHLVFIFAALLLLAPPLRAQEAQVPLDESGRVLEIDRELAQRIGILTDRYPDLEFVRLYEVGDGSFILEVTRQRDGRRVRERVPMTGEEVRELRARVTALLEARAPGATRDQDGRYLLLAATTAMGIGFYGWAVPVILDIESSRGVLASYMFTAGASFLIPYLYTRDRPVTYGMANAGFWGVTRGTVHGVYLANLLDRTPSPSMVAGLAMLGSVGEGLAGYTWAGAEDMSAGRAHTIGNYGDFGDFWAGSFLAITQPDDEAVAYASLLAGSAAGIGIGAARSRALPYTWGDAEVQRLAFFLGAGHGVVAWDWLFGDGATDDEVRVLGAAVLAGSIGGLVLGNNALRGLDFSPGQALLVDLGTVAGGLLGAGIGVLLSPETDTDPTAILTLAALGADLGFLATMGGLSDDARRRARRAPAPAGRMDLEVNPGALLLLRHPTRLAGEPGGIRAPLVAFRYRF